MRRWLLITGLILLVIFGFFTWLGYAAAQSDCATNIFTGNETNPSACSSDGGLFVVGIFMVIVALILTILGAILKSKEAKPGILPAPAQPGMPAGKVCLRCGTFYAEPVPAFCSKCGGPVGAGAVGPPASAPPGK